MTKSIKLLLSITVLLFVIVIGLKQFVWIKFNLSLSQWLSGDCSFDLITESKQKTITISNKELFHNYLNNLTNCRRGIKFSESPQKSLTIRKIIFIVTDAGQSTRMTKKVDNETIELYSTSLALDESKRVGYIYLNLHLDVIDVNKQDKSVIDVIEREIARAQFGDADTLPREQKVLQISNIGLTYAN